MNNCLVCNTEFKGRKGKSNKFCSLVCYHYSLKGVKKGAVMEVVECKNCEKMFESKPSDKRKYCSRECYVEINKTDIGTTASCKICDKEYIKTVKNQKYCSPKCSNLNLLEHNGTSSLSEKICKGCFSVFKPRNRYLTYCSKDCYNGCRRKERTINCVYCDKEFLRHGASGRFCSEPCRGKHYTGENNPTYNNYLTTSSGYLRYSAQHRKYAGEYVHRIEWMNHHDTRKCNRCERDVEHIHHIDRDKLNNSIDNLEGLCKNCHAQEHAGETPFWKYRKSIL